uniref:Retrotransposon gag domain-containing protein n=1 Tax=Nicotiana tabacum TaxID=4097 RepID=A0A1S4AVT1_TOBAC|nr:PREDICTED: uncharacterized protein LOC107801892 [Nicotiana tabacum]
MTGSENSAESDGMAQQMLKEALEKIERMGLEMRQMQLALAKVQKEPESSIAPHLPSGHTPEYPHHDPSANQHYSQERGHYDTQAPPPNTNPPPPSAPIFMAPPPLQRPLNEPLFQAHDTQYFPPEPTFKAPEPYAYKPHFEIPVEIERPDRSAEQDELTRKFKSLEQSFRSKHGLDNHVSMAYKDLCPFPNARLPAGFKMPKFDLYEGHGDPVAHLRGFCNTMRGAGGKEELLIAYFSQSLKGAALEWYTRQDPSKWYTWDDLTQAFTAQFHYNLEIVPDRLTIQKTRQKPGESFREFGFRWRDQAARVDPPMKEGEMVDYFLQTLEPTYFGHLVTTVGKSFNEVVKIGSMIEEGLRADRLLNYSALKATTHAIQGGTGGAPGRRKKEEVATAETSTWSKPNYPAPPHTPYNPPPQHYYPPPEPHFSVYQAQTYTQPPAHPQWRAPIPQITYPPPQNTYLPPQNTYPPPRAYRNPPGAGGRGNQAFRNERVQRRTYTELGETYTALFHKLRQLGLLSPVENRLPNPPPPNVDRSLSCEYCSGMLGHDTEKCWKLKRAIQDLIDANKIEVQAPEKEKSISKKAVRQMEERDVKPDGVEPRFSLYWF